MTDMISRTFTRGLLAASVLVLGTAMFACGSSGGSAPPTASAIFIHDASDLGSVEILADGELIARADPGEMTKRVALPTGDHKLALRNPGAASSILEEDFGFNAQTYLIAFNGAASDQSLEFWRVDTEPPALADDEAAVEVVSLYDGEFKFDIYVSGVLLAESIALRESSPFQTVDFGIAEVQIFNAGNDPSSSIAILTEEINLDAGSATLILLQNVPEGGTGEIAISTVPVR